jgi:hypothetical protein
MMILSILLKAYALVYWPIGWPVALGCWSVSLAFDVRWLRHRSSGISSSARGLYGDLVLFNTGALAIGLVLCAAFLEATMRWKSGLAPAAKAVEWLFGLLKFPTGSFQGRLYASTMVGSTSYPVNLDTLGLLLPLLIFAIGSLCLLLCASRWRPVVRGMFWLGIVLLCVVLLRWVFATSLFLGLCDFVNYETEDLPIAPFFKPGFIAVLYLPFLACAAVVLHRPLLRCAAPDPSAPGPARRQHLWIWVPLALLLLLIFWEPRGTPKNGTVLINTFHTEWSRTDRPYDREWYGPASGYNYACLKRLYERFFNVRELAGRITAEDLATASVLVIYDPNRSFTEEEIQAVRNFVARGGGLFVIGDHTNVFGSTSHLDQLLNGMGFQFRDDVLFDLDEDFFQLKDVSPPHSGLLHGIRFFKFRGPTSIRSTSIFSRNVFTLGNAKSLRAIYSVNNFYPPPHDHPKMWTGDFSVAMTSRHGRGRVVGFADSTVFSNFEIFYPGKYEFLLNVADWLNRTDPPVLLPFKRVALLGAILLIGVQLFRAGRPRRVLGTLVAVCLMGMSAWTIARLVEQAQIDFPKPIRPVRFLFFAAEPEDEALTLRSFVTDTPYEQKYDVFIQWVLRDDIFPGFHLYGQNFDNALARMLSDSRQAETGLALIATRPEHLALLEVLTPGPMTNADRLLLMFSGTFSWEDVRGPLAGVLTATGLAQAEAARPSGVARIVEPTRRVVVVFDAERFSDRQMGFSEKVTPTPAQRQLYEEQFQLLDWLFDSPQATVDSNPATAVDRKD